MDAKTTKPIDGWQPTTEAWGTAAFEETKIHFYEVIMNSEEPGGLAFAVWALSHDPFLEGDELLNFGGGCGDDLPSGQQIDKALNVLGLSAREKGSPKKKKAGARKGGKRLSSVEKAILANFKDASRLITAYREAKKAVEKARKDLEKAGNELRSIDREKAHLLSQFDAQAASVLEELQILDGENPDGDPMAF